MTKHEGQMDRLIGDYSQCLAQRDAARNALRRLVAALKDEPFMPGSEKAEALRAADELLRGRGAGDDPGAVP